MNYYLEVLKKYVQFDGRAQRAEYWYFVLFNVIISFAINIVSVMTDSSAISMLGVLYSLGVFLPSLAVLARRLHDIGKSGWMMLVALIPLVGWIWLLVLLVTDSDAAENKYGPNPKATVAATPTV